MVILRVRNDGERVRRAQEEEEEVKIGACVCGVGTSGNWMSGLREAPRGNRARLDWAKLIFMTRRELAQHYLKLGADRALTQFVFLMPKKSIGLTCRTASEPMGAGV
jgi:hypothetical protein